MNGQGNKIAISVFLGAMVIAAALYFGLTKTNPLTSQPNTITPTLESSPTITSLPTITEKPIAQTPMPTASPTPEITWTKSDIITALSTKTGIPESEITFSTSETIDHGNTKLIRGGVKREGEMSGAGFFAVADANGVKVTYAGQGVPECSEVNPYGYPTSWVDYCMEGTDTIRR